MTETVRLGDYATARSGDKGNHANIGVVALDPSHYNWLLQEVTAERVADFFAALKPERVTRYELANVAAINLVLENVLAGGASRSLRIDTQGKLLGTALLELPVHRPNA